MYGNAKDKSGSCAVFCKLVRCNAEIRNMPAREIRYLRKEGYEYANTLEL